MGVGLTWIADPASTYEVLAGPRPDQLTPAATFTGKPGHTATVPPARPSNGVLPHPKELRSDPRATECVTQQRTRGLIHEMS